MQDFLPVTREDMKSKGWDTVDFVYVTGDAYVDHPSFGSAIIGRLLESRGYRVGMIPQPIILGGIEASLRRMAHYDYWENKVKHSILIDSGADLISYGMGEHSILEIAEALQSGIPVQEITYVAGTVFKSHDINRVYEPVILPAFEQVQSDKKAYADSFAIQYRNTDPFTARPLVESYGNRGYVIQNPPAKPLTQMEMDDVYDLPYTGQYHPMYKKDGGIPALKEIKFSLTSNRGCFGSCNFCALTFHQGRILQTRSHESILREAEKMTEDPDFKGYIHDVGGPTADFRHPSCKKQLTKGVCRERQCLFPSPCKNLTVDHKDYLQLLRKVRNLPKVKKVFIRSGIRFDYMVADPDKTFLNELVKYHVSGQLRVAPEHVSDEVLKYMGKPKHAVYESFLKEYETANARTGKQQYAVPYFMSSHPGCTMKEAVKLAEYVRDLGFTPEQVQDFYPTPSTLSTCMYYTGIHPLTGEKVYVPKNPHEKAIQRALMQYKNPENRELILEGLKMTGRMDLVGFGPKCLIHPRELRRKNSKGKNPESRSTDRRNLKTQTRSSAHEKYQKNKKR